jgi:DNA-damage-inducible protein J
MSNKSSITIRTDNDIKLEAQNILNNLGLDMSTSINIFLRQVIQHGGLPFNVNLNVPNSITLKALSDTAKNKNLVGPFNSVEDLIKDLDA